MKNKTDISSARTGQRAWIDVGERQKD